MTASVVASWRYDLAHIRETAKLRRAGAESAGVRDAFARIVAACDDGLMYGSCRHCGAPLAEEYNCCASCAEEGGP